MFSSKWNLNIRIEPQDFIICISDENIIISKDRNLLPKYKECDDISFKYKPIYLGDINQTKCFFSEIEEYDKSVFIDLRAFMRESEKSQVLAVSTAITLNNWIKYTTYCGACGKKTQFHKTEKAKICTNCHKIYFPKISPAVITLIEKKGKPNKILLAYNRNFKTKVFALIAGFVDPGESLEGAVKREIMEEVNIKVKNIRYFDSQPWPFPDSLMIGFLAEYDSGIIQPDGIEICEADWFDITNLPEIPQKGSISRKLIDSYIKREKNEK